jgi:2-iminobutanoate/2-iminopropanoate deaminase
MVHKKFDGRASTTTGEPIVLNWQTIYWLRRFPSGWKITGFLGFLPNPMPAAHHTPPTGITLPAGASQHVTAGPYSPALRIVGPSLVAISGQGPIDQAGNIVGETIQQQAELTLANCRQQLETAGVHFKDVFKVVVYLGDMSEWDAFNEVYRRHFAPPYPVRTAIQVGLWGGMKVEIDMLAISR